MHTHTLSYDTQGHTLLACIARSLRCLAQNGPMAVVVTNHVVAQRDGAFLFKVQCPLNPS